MELPSSVYEGYDAGFFDGMTLDGVVEDLQAQSLELDDINGDAYNPNTLYDHNARDMQDYSLVNVKGEVQEFSLMDVNEWELPSSDRG
jgi:hypothetical protein